MKDISLVYLNNNENKHLLVIHPRPPLGNSYEPQK